MYRMAVMQEQLPARYMGKAVSLGNVYVAPPNAYACANAWAGIASDVPNAGHAGAFTGEVHGCTEWRSCRSI